MKNIRAFCGSGIFLPKFTSNSNPRKFIKKCYKISKKLFYEIEKYQIKTKFAKQMLNFQRFKSKK